MAPWSSLALLLVANALLSIALVVFASGFFPYKPYKPGHASFDPEHEPDGPAPAPFDKLIFMVVDALRRYQAPSQSDRGIGCQLT